MGLDLDNIFTAKEQAAYIVKRVWEQGLRSGKMDADKMVEIVELALNEIKQGLNIQKNEN